MSNQRTGSCTICIIIPLLIGLFGLAVLYWATKESKAQYIENDLGIKSNNLLAEQQVGGVIVHMDGRDAMLTGSVENAPRSQEIENIITSLAGIRMVDNQLEIAQTKANQPVPIVEPIVEKQPAPVAAQATEPEPEESAPLQQEAIAEMLQALDLSAITFLFDSDEITEQSINILDDVSRILHQHQQFDVVVTGHTDSVGDDHINQDLSQRRAQAIMHYLIRQGIQSSRLYAIGYGESEPIASNETQEGRAINRRIEFRVARREEP